MARPEFSEHGIGGAELLILNQRSGEVLALVRRFYQMRPAPNSLGQISNEVQQRGCTNLSPEVTVQHFVPLVLKPAR